MTLQNQLRTWLILVAITVLVLWVFRGILLPFVVGMALAYLLDPMTDQLERWHFKRVWAVSLIMFVVVLIFAGLLLLAVPLALQQIMSLIQQFPDYVVELQQLGNQLAPELYRFLGADRMQRLQDSMSQLLTSGVGLVGTLTGQIMQSGLALINTASLFIVSPVVAFYLLLDWDRMVSSADDLLPRPYKADIRQVVSDIDKAMSAVIRGQAAVVVVLAIFYATALSVAGLSFGLAIGMIAGFLSFVPYVGFAVGFVLSMGVAVVQFWPDWIMIVVIFMIYAVGQFLEGNVLYPKLVGSSIGVHPVWLMFALFAFGLIFGFVGLLLAVPMAAIASVLARFVVGKYRASDLYKGDKGGDDDAAAAG